MFILEKAVRRKNKINGGKGYLIEGLFKLNIIVVVMKKAEASSYLIDSNESWYERLGYVNYKTLQKFICFEVLPSFECNKSKCQACAEFKYTKHLYKSVERNSIS